MAKQGRPTTYKPSYCKKVIEWGKEGKLPVIWANNLNTTTSTLSTWQINNPSFKMAYKQGKQEQLQYELNKLEADPNYIKVIQWKLGVFHHLSATKQIESKVEHSGEVHNKIEVSFGDRE